MFYADVSEMSDFEISRGPYTRLSRTASEDKGDRGASAVDDVVAGAATRAAAKAELTLLDWHSHGDRSCVEQVRDGSGVLHFGCCWK